MESQACWHWGQMLTAVLGMTVKRTDCVGVSCWTWTTVKPSRRSNWVQKSKGSFALMAKTPRGRKGCQVSFLFYVCTEDHNFSEVRGQPHWFEQHGWETGKFGEADTLARA